MKKVLTFFLMALSFSQVMCNDLTWNAPQTISGTTASDPQVVMDTSGNVTSVWVEGGVIKASNLPSGGSWSAPTTLSGSTASIPRTGIDSSGNVTATWVENGVVMWSTLPSGGSWTTEASLSSSGGSTPALAVDATGNAIAVWVRGGFIETSTKLFGGSWGSVNAFTDANSDNPDVAIGSNGTAIIVSHTVVSSQDQIRSSTATVGGSWGATKNAVASATAPHHWNYPHVAVGALGNAVAVWYQYDLGGTFGTDYVNTALVSGILVAGAPGWTAPTTLSTSTTGAINPANLREKWD